MRVGIWVCDGCGIEDRGGMPGFPPDTWVRVKATEKNRTESPAHDLCPGCSRTVDALAIAGTGNPIVQPTRKTATKRASKVTESGGDVDDDEGENE